ncbi:hypothetical protein ACP275_09G125100 [Erythranthe tilingii]
MEESSSSFKEDDAQTRKNTKIYDNQEYDEENNGTKRRRSNRCFSFMEISIDPGVKSLKQLDSIKFKDGIKKWAKAVVTYARQVSIRIGSSRRTGSDE